MRTLPDFVLTYVGVAMALSLVWFAVRDHPHWAAHRWAAPRVAALRVWVSRAPATFVYMAIWTATSILAQGQPLTISELVARYASTNLYNFHSEPFRTLVASSFLVAENGLFYPFYVVAFVLVAARLEHRVGAARWLAVAAVAHVGGSLIILALERIGIWRDLLPHTVALTEDIGVSYVLAGAMGAYVWLVRHRWAYMGLLVLGFVVPLLIWPGLGSAGHFIAAGLGLLTGRFVVRWPLRPPVSWRALTSAAAAESAAPGPPATPAS